MFDRTARLYDLIYERGLGKDYEADAALVASYLPPSTRTVLDVACGTGLHLQHLRHRYDCTGLDLDADMLAVARQRCPDVPLVEADMVDFDLGRTFDGVLCLFSSIGYVRTEARLRQTAATFARHLAPGGVVVVELWLTPDQIITGHVGVLHASGDGVEVQRMSQIDVDGTTSTIQMHYLIGTPDGVTHEHEAHELGLFTHDQYRDAFEAAGLSVSIDPNGSAMGRGLLVAVSPSPS
jgi:SAM-dependent methyltransferase